MEKHKYKFENYRDRDFPVYSANTKGRTNLVHPHFHEDAEISLVVCGKLLLTAGTTVTELEKGDIAIIPPSVTHSARAVTEDAEIRGLVFNLKVLNQPVSFSLNSDCFVIDKGSSLHQKFTEELNKAISIYLEQGIAYKMKMTAQLLILMSVLAEEKIVSDNENDGLERRLTPALDYISKNFSQPIKISELSTLVCVCDDHFIRLFKAATSRTPSEYIMDLRISKAMNLLSTDTYSVSEIAEKTGFLNSAYFTKIFKKKLGITPTKYRKNFLS